MRKTGHDLFKASAFLSPFLVMGGVGLAGPMAKPAHAARFEFCAHAHSGCKPASPPSAQKINGAAAVEATFGGASYFVTGIVGKTPIKFIVDTGAETVMLTKKDIAKTAMDLKRLQFNTLGYAIGSRPHFAGVILARLVVGNCVFTNIEASVPQEEKGMPYSLLGLTALRKAKLTLDHGHMKLGC